MLIFLPRKDPGFMLLGIFKQAIFETRFCLGSSIIKKIKK